jgi:hypothetical protein
VHQPQEKAPVWPMTVLGQNRLSQADPAHELGSPQGGIRGLWLPLSLPSSHHISSFSLPLLCCRCTDGLCQLLILASPCRVMLPAMRFDLALLLLFLFFLSYPRAGFGLSSSDRVGAGSSASPGSILCFTSARSDDCFVFLFVFFFVPVRDEP